MILSLDKKNEEAANARMIEFTLIALSGISKILDYWSILSQYQFKI